MKRGIFILFVILFATQISFGQSPLKLAKLKYNGGGDWYANKTALSNLIMFCNKNMGMDLHPSEEIV